MLWGILWGVYHAVFVRYSQFRNTARLYTQVFLSAQQIASLRNDDANLKIPYFLVDLIFVLALRRCIEVTIFIITV